MASWITMDEACRLLDVRPQTIYAYVSRGKLEAQVDPADSRRSLYRADDVDALARRKQAGRKHQTVATNTLFGAEPSIPTALSTFVRGRLYYRGHDAVELARTASLEDAARLLWDAGQPIDFTAGAALAPGDKPGRAAAFTLLAQRAAAGHSTRGRLTRVLHEESQGLVGALAEAFGARPGAGPSNARPLHLRFAQGWKQPTPVAELLRTALVLLVDHELTSSAFATRIAASTGASLPACLLAGLGTLSGPLHGDASGRVQSLFGEVERQGADPVLSHHLSSGQPLAGFGHHLYPDGDPRAAALLSLFDPPAAVARFIDKATQLTGLPPNIDIALAALVARYRLPADAAFGLFATARSVGLLAHALEQLGEAQVIRPRGRYVGPAPDAGAVDAEEASSAAAHSLHRTHASAPHADAATGGRPGVRPRARAARR